jgi:oxygen-independent coproporphyrinogen-3 oxidase
MPLGLYLHIPFCRQACSYCDFYFVTRHELIPSFVEAMIRDIRSWEGHPLTLAADRTVETVYLGGGTPSLLTPAQLADILQAIRDTFSADFREVTLEANPENITPELLEGYMRHGVDRLSIGIQSFDPAILHFMHRAHSERQAADALRIISDAGFRTWTADLIVGNPGQDLGRLDADIDRLLSFSPPHISAYALTVEDRTALRKQVDVGRILMPEQDDTAAHLDRLHERLLAEGIHRYEVSNYARRGHEALHNRRYWSHVPYLGFGPSAHSFLFAGDGRAASQEGSAILHSDANPPAGFRWSRHRDLADYLESPECVMDPDTDFPRHLPGRIEVEPLTARQLQEERLMLGLRTAEGVHPDELLDRYGIGLTPSQLSRIDGMREHGFATPGPTIRLTPKGLNIADRLILDLLTA